MEAHCSPYTVHHGGMKMYKDLKQTSWWPKLKKDVTRSWRIAWFVSKLRLSTSGQRESLSRLGGHV